MTWSFKRDRYLPISLDILSILFFITYLLLSIVLAEARVLYADSAYYVFRMIELDGFNIEHGRYVGYLTQWLPVLFIKLNLPLKAVITAYSFNVALLYFFGYLYVRCYLKMPFHAIGLILISLVTMHFGYYNICAELIQGCVPTVVGLFHLEKIASTEKKLIPIDIFWMAFFSVLVFFSHLFLTLAYSFIILLFFLQQRSKQFLIAAIVFVSIVIMKFLLAKNEGYENSMLDGFDLNNLNWQKIKSSYIYYFMKHSFNHQLVWIKVLLFSFILYGLFKRKWLVVFMSFSFIIGLMTLICLYMPEGNAVAYMDGYLGVIGLTIVVLFLVYVNKWTQDFNVQLIGIVLILASFLGMKRVYDEPLYQDRIAYYKTLFQEMDEKGTDKILMKTAEAPWHHLLVAWAIPFETLLLSSSDGNSKTLYVDQGEIDQSKLKNENLFLAEIWDPYHSIERVNGRYFNLPTKQYFFWSNNKE